MPKRSKLRHIGWILMGCLYVVCLTILIGGVIVGLPTVWKQSHTYEHWMVRYDGYGQVTTDDERITLAPKAAARDDITHGGLVHTTGSCGNTEFSLTVHTERQHRIGTPNAWEVGWILWNFQSDTHFYAVALKPNGWEVSKQDPDYPGNQRFLASGQNTKYPIGHDYHVTIKQHEDTITVIVDGKKLVTVVDTETPYLQGAIGLYTEDATAHFSNFQLPDCVMEDENIVSMKGAKHGNNI